MRVIAAVRFGFCRGGRAARMPRGEKMNNHRRDSSLGRLRAGPGVVSPRGGSWGVGLQRWWVVAPWSVVGRGQTSPSPSFRPIGGCLKFSGLGRRATFGSPRQSTGCSRCRLHGSGCGVRWRGSDRNGRGKAKKPVCSGCGARRLAMKSTALRLGGISISAACAAESSAG